MQRGAGPDGRGIGEWARWLIRTDHPTIRFLREVASTALIVIMIGVVLYVLSGVWPPMVAVESGSMEPHMYRGDLVFVVAPTRFAGPDAASNGGVISSVEGEEYGYSKFGAYGDVIVFKPDGSNGTPVIHRAHFWVGEGENWVERGDSDSLPNGSCETIRNCPAPHDGFITKGDANQYYDQVSGISSPVRNEWVTGRAMVRVPWLGYVRLALDGSYLIIGS